MPAGHPHTTGIPEPDIGPSTPSGVSGMYEADLVQENAQLREALREADSLLNDAKPNYFDNALRRAWARRRHEFREDITALLTGGHRHG